MFFELMFILILGCFDSLFFFFMVCFFDFDLDLFISLVFEQRDVIGGFGFKVNLVFVFCYMLVVGYVGVYLEKFLMRNRLNYYQNVFMIIVFVVLCSILCFLLYVYFIILWDWVDMLGWMEVVNGGGSFEQEIWSIG